MRRFFLTAAFFRFRSFVFLLDARTVLAFFNVGTAAFSFTLGFNWAFEQPFFIATPTFRWLDPGLAGVSYGWQGQQGKSCDEGGELGHDASPPPNSASTLSPSTPASGVAT